MTETTLYKITGPDGQSIHGGKFVYDLPVQNDDGTWTPGAWTPPVKNPTVCHRGYHLTSDPRQWLKVGCRAFIAEGKGDSDSGGDNTAFVSGRLLREEPDAIPAWWLDAEAVIEEAKSFPYFQPQGDPAPAWKVFETRIAARTARAAARTARIARTAARTAAEVAVGAAAETAARTAAMDVADIAARGAVMDAVRDVVWDAAMAAAMDVRLWAETMVVSDLIDPAHIDHVAARIDVWRRGYGLLCDVNGELYVYRKVI